MLHQRDQVELTFQQRYEKAMDFLNEMQKPTDSKNSYFIFNASLINQITILLNEKKTLSIFNKKNHPVKKEKTVNAIFLLHDLHVEINSQLHALNGYFGRGNSAIKLLSEKLQALLMEADLKEILITDSEWMQVLLNYLTRHSIPDAGLRAFSEIMMYNPIAKNPALLSSVFKKLIAWMDQPLNFQTLSSHFSNDKKIECLLSQIEFDDQVRWGMSKK